MDEPLRVMPSERDRLDDKSSMHNLATLVRVLSGASSLEEIVETTAEHVRSGLRSSTVSVSRLEPGTGLLRTLINVGELGPTEERWPQDETYNLEDYLGLRDVVNDQRAWTMSVTDDDADPTEVALLNELGKEAAMAMPIRVGGAVWGELYASYDRADAAFGDDDATYLEIHLALLESTLARTQQFESLARLAYQDPLTGLPNRRALDETAATAFERFRAGDMARLHVVATDLNGLKEVNDTRGHACGDELINDAASIIQTSFNTLPGSLAARIGGDEFVVLVPSHTLDSVIESAHTAVARVGALPLGRGASCGVATATDLRRDPTVGHLFRRADAAQYRSKRTGRPIVIDAAVPEERSA